MDARSYEPLYRGLLIYIVWWVSLVDNELNILVLAELPN